MSTLRVNNLKSRTGTAVTITSGHCLDVEGNLKIAGVSTFSAIASFTSGANVTGVVTFANVDIQNGNTNFTGIVTAKTFHGNIVGTAATFSGAVTYEDVTNVDSVGIVTARTGVRVPAGGVQGAEVWITKTGAYTAVSNERIMVDTSSAAITITLPASPAVGDVVSLMDLSGTFGTNNLTVARNGKDIMNVAENMTVDTTNASFDLVFTGNTQGWRLSNVS